MIRVSTKGRNCTKCGEWKTWDCFHLSKGRTTGRRPECRVCTNKYSRVFYTRQMKENPRKMYELNRWKCIRLKYGLSKQDFEERLRLQNNTCKICGNPFVKIPCVDHCHKSDTVRGLLCNTCNVLVGCMEKSPEYLSKIENYIKEY